MKQKKSSNLIDSIWELNNALAQTDIEIYDILRINSDSFEVLISEYGELFNKKANLKVLEKYFGLMIITDNKVTSGFRLEKDI